MMSLERLLLLAHGSGDPKWKQPFEALESSVAESVGAAAVGLAFMQFATPSLEEAVAQAELDRVSRLDVLPIFLSAGAHIERDIPELIRLSQTRYPSVAIRLLPAVGTDARMGSLLRTLALEAVGAKMATVVR